MKTYHFKSPEAQVLNPSFQLFNLSQSWSTNTFSSQTRNRATQVLVRQALSSEMLKAVMRRWKVFSFLVLFICSCLSFKTRKRPVPPLLYKTETCVNPKQTLRTKRFQNLNIKRKLKFSSNTAGEKWNCLTSEHEPMIKSKKINKRRAYQPPPSDQVRRLKIKVRISDIL